MAEEEEEEEEEMDFLFLLCLHAIESCSLKRNLPDIPENLTEKSLLEHLTSFSKMHFSALLTHHETSSLVFSSSFLFFASMQISTLERKGA